MTLHSEEASWTTVSSPAWWISTHQLISTQPMGFMAFLLSLHLSLWEVMKHIFLVLPGARPGSQFDLWNTADSLIELSLRAPCLACTNHNTEHGAMWLMGNDRRWISRGKIMGFNHVKVLQAQSSLAASCPAQVRAGVGEANNVRSLVVLF